MKSVVTIPQRWLDCAASTAGTAAALLAVCLLTPLAGAAEKAVQSGGSAVASINAASQAGTASAQGAWNFVMKTPVGDRKVSFKFAVDGTVLKGTMTDDDGTSEIFDGSVEGTTLKWSAKVSKPMSMTLKFTGELSGDSITGGARSMMGTAKFTAQRA